MRAVVQRVSFAHVRVDDRTVGEIGIGLLVFAGVEKGDGPNDIAYIAGKVRDLRIFDDEAGKMNLSVEEAGGAVLAISQFTLCGDFRKGRGLVTALRALNLKVESGEFQAHMHVELANDGPVTILLDSRRRW